MKGDFTRDTFDSEKHYQQVLMQQGRAQLDADWNEQAAISIYRDETTALNIIGKCGGPEDHAAFGIVTYSKLLLEDQQSAYLEWRKSLGKDQDIQIQALLGKIGLTAGHYYVDGILCECEVERPFPFGQQPDWAPVLYKRPTFHSKFLETINRDLSKTSVFLIYLDVWQRHLTAVEDGDICESALGGPDTATRVKTVWQVRAFPLTQPPKQQLYGEIRCPSQEELIKLIQADPNTASLTADVSEETGGQQPCALPLRAGYTGMENQLYRVEIQTGQAASPPKPVTGSAVTFLEDRKKLQVSPAVAGLKTGDFVEVFATASETLKDLMKGELAIVVDVDTANTVVTLDAEIKELKSTDKPHLRKVDGAIWKWSRDNGSVVFRLEKIDANHPRKVTVSTLGPDTNLGLSVGDWVEILDDTLELEGEPGELSRIADIDKGSGY